jgi:protein-S-isoprenylcysteine O-methyltransferase Ste14
MRKALELRVPPVIVLFVGAIGIWALDQLVPAARFAYVGLRPAAVGILLVGLGIAARGVIVFARHRTTVHPSHPDRASAVVTGDVFSRTRNPMYVGLTLALLSFAVWRGSLAGAVIVVPLFVIYMTEFQIKPEERALTEKFGAPYVAYLQTVRRWL